MAELASEYINAMAKALLEVRPRPSAVQDVTARILRDRPGDIVGYLESCRSALPSYFMSAEPTEPVVPTPGADGYNDWFIKNLEKIAGSTTAVSTAAAKAQPPRQISRSSPTFDKQFVTHLDAIASGQCEVIQ